MSIAAVQTGGQIFDNQLNADRTMASAVTSGNLLVVTAARFDTQSDPYEAANLAYNAGTATIGTPTLHVSEEIAYDGGGNTISVGIWTVPVTGSGTLTLRVTTGRNVYTTMSASEFSASSGWDATGANRVTGTPSTGETATNGTTAVSSGNTTSAAGALFVGVCGFDASGTLSIAEDGAFTLIAESQDASAHMTGSHIYRIVTTGTTDAAEWTCGTGNNGWVAAVVALREVTPEGGGAGATGRGRLVGGKLVGGILVGVH